MGEWLESHRFVGQTAAAALAALALYLMVRGDLMIFGGIRRSNDPEQSAWIIRGFRRVIVAIGLLFLAGGFYWAAVWPFLFAAVFLGEELFETGIMLAALHDQRREADREARRGGGNGTA